MKLYLKIAIVVVAFVAGFFLGRKTIDVKNKKGMYEFSSRNRYYICRFI